jgi:EpsI family protein
MRARVRSLLPLAAPVFLLAQALAVHLTAGVERAPGPPDLASLPGRMGSWINMGDDPVQAAVLAVLRADQMLSRLYTPPSRETYAGLFVAWFRTQRGGERQPHSPKVCLPAAGWTPQDTRDITLETAAGPITVNRMTISSRFDRSVVLYWYQTRRRVISGEWAAKFWLVADGLRDRRTDMALVRIVVPSKMIGDSRAQALGEDFARRLYPALKEILPR